MYGTVPPFKARCSHWVSFAGCSPIMVYCTHLQRRPRVIGVWGFTIRSIIVDYQSCPCPIYPDYPKLSNMYN